MKPAPKHPPRDRDTSQIARSLIVALIAYLALAIAIAHLKP